MGIEVVGFVDDDAMKVGTVIQGHKVLGDSASIARIAKERSAEQAIITIASAAGSTIRKIVEVCEKAGLPVKIIPGIYEILQGKVGISRIREVTIEDLLGREAVELDLEAIGRFLRGKRVLVTGAGGSIGSELCRQVARFDPEQIILLEQAENPLFEIDGEMRRERPNLDAVPVIADVCDSNRVDTVFSRFRPQVVFHAAAHKHVPMMEWNPGEALKNNIFGTRKVADAADRFGAEAVVMISTDKAVNPTSVMGASKRVAEVYVQALARRSKTKFVAVRFGNVLGSAGSVIPTFKEQIRRGGPITVTHPEMKRYFMTIPEACQLVMEAATMGQGGEIFVLDMGEPVRIADLARDLIRLSGLTEEEIPIVFTGVRPGEKLFEELSTNGENMSRTRHPKIFIGRIAEYPYAKVTENLAVIAGVTNAATRAEAVAALRTCVPEMCDSEASRLATPAHPVQPSDTVH
jgi:FlaA1/EpsC-like NDP-sugar epimerase